MIRAAAAEDAGALAMVHIASWQAAYRGIFRDVFLDSLDAASRERWWSTTLQRGAEVLVADEEGVVVGFCYTGPADDEGWGEVYAIYVHPGHWGSGHGRDLLRAGENALRSQGFGRALLWVLEQNDRGRRFYERQGWLAGRPLRIEEIGETQVTEIRYEIEFDEAR